MRHTTSEIDFVITWVDGRDPEWLREKAQYSGLPGDSGEGRYRDWGVLRYWFRAVERYAPWVRRVHFVTWGHVPEWLDVGCDALRIVRHTDFIPGRYLPTFSCRPIEFNLYRIPGLSERFVYFNDDMFLTGAVRERDFFKGGLPCDTAILDAAYIYGGRLGGRKSDVSEYNSSPVMNMVPLNRNFVKGTVVGSSWAKWYSPKYGPQVIRNVLLLPWKHFTGIKSFHVPYSLLCSTYEEVWEREGELLDRACSHRFRDSSDVSSRLLSYWQLASGRFAPRSPRFGRLFYLTGRESDDDVIREAIVRRRYKAICINDELEFGTYEETRERLVSCFESVFPDKSLFEA